MSTIDITFSKLTPVRGMDEIADLRDIIKGHAFIAGGYARYVVSPLANDTVAIAEDIDLFSRSAEDFTYLMKVFADLGFKSIVDNDLAVTFETGKAGFPKVQLIKPFREGTTGNELKDILIKFDFTVTMVGIDDDGSVLAHYCFNEDEKKKRLRLLTIHCPVSSIRRFCKYAKKGYTFTMQEAAKLFVDYGDRPDAFKASVKRLATFTPGNTTKEESQDIKHMYLEMFID